MCIYYIYILYIYYNVLYICVYGMYSCTCPSPSPQSESAAHAPRLRMEDTAQTPCSCWALQQSSGKVAHVRQMADQNLGTLRGWMDGWMTFVSQVSKKLSIPWLDTSLQ